MEWTPHLIGLEVSKWKLDHPLVPQTEASIMQVATVGIDLAESIFHVHSVDSTGHIVFSKPLRRAQMPEFFATLAGDEDDDSPMAQMLDAPQADMRQALDHSLHLAMQDGIPAPMQALMGEDQSQNTLQRLTGLREQLEKKEQTQQTPITVLISEMLKQGS